MVAILDQKINVFDIWLQTMTERTWKILKLDWNTPVSFFIQKIGSHVLKSIRNDARSHVATVASVKFPV